MTAVHRISTRRLPARRLTLLLSLTLGALSAGCARTTIENFPNTSEVIERADYLERRFPSYPAEYQAAAQQRIDEILSKPLSLSGAMEIAMLNNPGLQEHYISYQIRDSDHVDALAEAARAETDSNETALEWKAAQLTLLKSVNRARWYDFPDEYIGVVDPFLEVGEIVRKAYYEAVASEQVKFMLQEVATATKAAAELANEQYRAGSANRRSQVLQQLTHAEAVKALAAAELGAVATREALNRALGLWGDDAEWRTPDRLPQLPADRPAYEGLEDYALQNRPDALAQRRTWQFWHTAIEIRSEVRENSAALLNAYDLAKYQQEVVLPLSRSILEETQKEYSGMLMGVYELLEDTRGQIEAGREYVETLKNYWIAEAELVQSVGGRLPNEGASE